MLQSRVLCLSILFPITSRDCSTVETFEKINFLVSVSFERNIVSAVSKAFQNCTLSFILVTLLKKKKKLVNVTETLTNVRAKR